MSSWLSSRTSSPWFAPTIYRVPCQTWGWRKKTGNQSVCVLKCGLCGESSLTNQLGHSNLLIIQYHFQVCWTSLLRLLSTWKRVLLFPAPGEEPCPQGSQLCDGFIHLAADRSTFQESKHGTRQGEFIPCVNAYHRETIWVYRRT